MQKFYKLTIQRVRSIFSVPWNNNRTLYEPDRNAQRLCSSLEIRFLEELCKEQKEFFPKFSSKNYFFFFLKFWLFFFFFNFDFFFEFYEFFTLRGLKTLKQRFWFSVISKMGKTQDFRKRSSHFLIFSGDCSQNLKKYLLILRVSYIKAVIFYIQ